MGRGQEELQKDDDAKCGFTCLLGIQSKKSEVLQIIVSQTFMSKQIT